MNFYIVVFRMLHLDYQPLDHHVAANHAGQAEHKATNQQLGRGRRKQTMKY